MGTYQDLVANNMNLSHLMDKTDDVLVAEEKSDQTLVKLDNSYNTDHKQAGDSLDKEETAMDEEPGETAELLAKGRVRKYIYFKYFLSGSSVCRIVSLFAAFLLAQLVMCSTDWWLAYWTNQEELRNSYILKSKQFIPDNTSIDNHVLNTLDIKGILENLTSNTISMEEVSSPNGEAMETVASDLRVSSFEDKLQELPFLQNKLSHDIISSNPYQDFKIELTTITEEGGWEKVDTTIQTSEDSIMQRIISSEQNITINEAKDVSTLDNTHRKTTNTNNEYLVLSTTSPIKHKELEETTQNIIEQSEIASINYTKHIIQKRQSDELPNVLVISKPLILETVETLNNTGKQNEYVSTDNSRIENEHTTRPTDQFTTWTQYELLGDVTLESQIVNKKYVNSNTTEASDDVPYQKFMATRKTDLNTNSTKNLPTNGIPIITSHDTSSSIQYSYVTTREFETMEMNNISKNSEGLNVMKFKNNDIKQETVLPLLTKVLTNESVFSLHSNDSDHDGLLSSKTCLVAYVAFVGCCVVFAMFRTLFYVDVCVRSSQSLHNQMVSSIVSTSMSFFDVNPSGRILNRFSKDQGTVDEMLPVFMLMAIQILFVVLGIIILVAMQNIWSMIPLFFAAILYWKLSKLYLRTAQDVQRLEGVTRSPVFSHVTATLDGLTTIRASEMQELVKREFDDLQDQHTAAWSLTLFTGGALSLWADFVTLGFMSCVIFIFIFFSSHMTGAFIGLALSQTLMVLGIVSGGITLSNFVANNMVSVERLIQYIELAPEPGSEPGTGQRSPAGWPALGRIQFQDFGLQYSLVGPTVLHNLNLTIESGEKVGIVGRTGAGKTSIALALFRFAWTHGKIQIDRTDTRNVVLQDLRKHISIIPQEPVLFSGPVRVNLDPTGTVSDAELWQVLDEVELKGVVSSLSFTLQEGGSNLSVGQRQLLCLARVILRRNKILVLDEATANIDPQTDALIQQTIRQKFRDCTVLTIAHRLNTIMDSDRVLVIDAGQIVEFDHPHILLQNPDGNFYKMVHNTDQGMAEQLKKTAKESYAVRNTGDTKAQAD